MPLQTPNKFHRLVEYLAHLQDIGRLTFTKSDALKALSTSEVAFIRSAERLMKKGQVIHPSRGFYVIVPAEHRSAGAPPISWFINELMKFHCKPYYVGILSAAALHGAAHQAPQEFQVITNTQLRPIRAGRARIRFLRKTGMERTPTQSIRTPYGDIPVSTPEATAFDLMRYVHRAGRLSNVTTVLIELAEKIDAKKLVEAAKVGVEIPIVQRVGYLLDTFADPKRTRYLHQWLSERRPAFTALRPNWNPPRAIQPKREDRWRLLINETVEPDV